MMLSQSTQKPDTLTCPSERPAEENKPEGQPEPGQMAGPNRGAHFAPRLLSVIVVGIIRLYQLFISPLLGPRCRFYPSCSSYFIESIRLHGAARGFLRGVKRLMRCHPFAQGGVDLP